MKTKHEPEFVLLIESGIIAIFIGGVIAWFIAYYGLKFYFELTLNC